MQELSTQEVPVKSFISVQVIEPITITVQEQENGFKSSFTSYLVKLKTNHWAFKNERSEIRRRFSEFLWLRSKLQEHYPDVKLPKLPPKRYLHLTQFNSRIIADRCAGLQKFLQELLKDPLFISDPAVLMFLQTDLTIEEIERDLRANLIKGIHTETNVNNSNSRTFSWDDNKSDLTSTSSCGSIYSSGGFKSGADVERELDDHEAKLGFMTTYENPDNLLEG